MCRKQNDMGQKRYQRVRSLEDAATAEDARLKRIAAMCGHPDAAEACRLILAEVQEAMTEQDDD